MYFCTMLVEAPGNTFGKCAIKQNEMGVFLAGLIRTFTFFVLIFFLSKFYCLFWLCWVFTATHSLFLVAVLRLLIAEASLFAKRRL